jgi:hypothetical protein
MPSSEFSKERLAKEAQELPGGGTASTARTLGFISYYALANSRIKARLQEELMILWPSGRTKFHLGQTWRSCHTDKLSSNKCFGKQRCPISSHHTVTGRTMLTAILI